MTLNHTENEIKRLYVDRAEKLKGIDFETFKAVFLVTESIFRHGIINEKNATNGYKQLFEMERTKNETLKTDNEILSAIIQENIDKISA